MIMMTPAAATTHRLLTPVRRTRPTFSEKAVYGNELKMPPMVVATPSARRTLPMSEALTRLPTISPGRDGAAGRLDRGDQQHDDHRETGDEVELGQAEQERRREAERRRLGDLAERHVAQRVGHRATDDETEQHRDGRQESPPGTAVGCRR